MKRYLKNIIPIIIAVLVCTSAFLFFKHGLASEICLFYNQENAPANGKLLYSLNKFSGTAFASSYEWDGSESGKSLTVPDEYKGCKVTALGGYYGRGVPSAFRISLPSSFVDINDPSYDGVYCGDISEFDIEEPYMVENIEFTVNIGKNLEKTERIAKDEYYPHRKDDGTLIFYHPVIKINCSSENKTFYSKDGKLYEHKNDNLIDDFPYN